MPGYATRWARSYDAWFGDNPHTDDTVETLARLAGAGPVLELGIGTGRVALPLRERGVDVHGIDASAEMVECLRAKPGGAGLPVTVGDLTAPPLREKTYALIYIVGGTFFELQTQQDQLRCFTAAAELLAPGGLFVLDALLPEAINGTDSASGRPVPTAGTDLVLRYRVADRTQQRYVSHYVIVDDEGVHHVRVPFRYAGHGELDLMASLAGLRLQHRWGGWDRRPFGAASTFHVSAYQAAD
ncbi:class I SAM-dependent DNA methyltransferase [Actinomadura macrotermitis]|uniref:Cypemycin N-terminal methyltransferase n=1 Tax=Actinomadura macrotermitis TaxID=2585200 RepID=A0A7K0BT36_9ACTN|nr:class I SAM-dependent methyltransferase [Actinomadura macrotermitis]MQY04339.1 Cypemycin N-terminal methyltransferase [Actinomadura macrotermitis]